MNFHHVRTDDKHESTSRSIVTVCVVNDYHIIEISAGTICNGQMTQCRMNRYHAGRENPLRENFRNDTIIMHGKITQESTDLSIQITSYDDNLIPLIIKGNFIGGDVQHVSIGQKCTKRWDFRKPVTRALDGMTFEIYDEHLQHLRSLRIMLEFEIA